MKYLDGIKNDQINASVFGRSMFGIMDMCMRLTIRPVKHIQITYYKPLTESGLRYGDIKITNKRKE